MAGTLHMRHGHDRDIMSDMKGIRGRIKSHIESGRILQLFVKLVFKSNLCDKSAFFQNVKNMFHQSFLLSFKMFSATKFFRTFIPVSICSIVLFEKFRRIVFS